MPINTKELKILLIEDNPADQEIIIINLEESNLIDYAVFTASSLKEGFQKLEEDVYDIVLLDLSLPDSKGEDTIHSILSHYPGQTLIILTGYEDEKLGLSSLKEGAQDFMVKKHINSYTLNKSIIYAIERKETEHLLMKKGLEAQEQERRRIAKDLHDGVGQILTAVSLQLNALKERIPEEEQECVANEIRNVGTVISEIRNIAYNLMPSSVESFGLVQAVRNLCEKINRLNAISIEYELPHDIEELTKDVEVGLYRVIQEFINNTLKYAKASKLKLSIFKEGNQAKIRLEDDGIGFKYERDKIEGIGIKNMISRINIMKGQFQLNSTPGQGVKVAIQIPLAEKVLS